LPLFLLAFLRFLGKVVQNGEHSSSPYLYKER
jgi:hypothetical protein